MKRKGQAVRYALASAVLCAALCAALCAGASTLTTRACELVLTDHRSGAPLQRLPLPSAELSIVFEHSVLGTTVTDRYRFETGATGSRAVLVEEQFEGQGYGLPHTASAGETLTREGNAWRLQLRRPVHPLVVRPLPAQRMRLVLQGREWLLASFSHHAIELRAEGCAPSKPT